MRVSWAMLLLGVLSVPATGGAAASTQPETRTIAVTRTAGEIVIDGDLSDSGWQGAARIDTFFETQPGDNIPPQVATVAWVTYDGKYFYIGVNCQDPEPGKIRAPFVDRDNVIGTDDNIAVFLDTRNDRRSAIEFRVNPRGLQGDASYNDANGNEDFSPDFFYDSAARITSEGWAAELRIPFSSLRYPNLQAQTWNILVWRNYPRDYRYAIHSSSIPRGSNCWICRSIELTGLTDLPSGGHIVAAPYLTAVETGRARGEPGSELLNEPVDVDGGLDLKWTPSASTVVDAAVNPDFSQIESDVGQIDVNNRFALFYPEKRPFFLEGVDLFDTPIAAVYTRTITSPKWGARATGKFGSSAFTLLVTEDRGGGSVILPGASFSDLAPQDFESVAVLGRLRQDFGKSFGGFLFAAREVEGGGYNRVFGPDFQWRPRGADQISFQALASDTETPDRPELEATWDGRRLRSYAMDLSWLHTDARWTWRLTYSDLGDDFRADNGFVPQVGYREARLSFGRKFYGQGILRQFQPYVILDRIADRDGDLVTRHTFPGVTIFGRNNLVVMAELYVKDQTRIGGQVLETTSFAYFFQIDPTRRFSRLSLRGSLGQVIDFANRRVGDGGDMAVELTLKPTDRLELGLRGERQWLAVDAGGGREGRLFTAQIERVKATYNFSARALLRLIGEYFHVDRDPSLYGFPVPAVGGAFNGTALLSYKLNWQTVFLLGYGDNSLLDRAKDLQRTDRHFFLKLSYAFQR